MGRPAKTLRDAGDMLAEAGRIIANGEHHNRAAIALLKLQLEAVLMHRYHLESTTAEQLSHRLNEALLPDTVAIFTELELAFDDEKLYPRSTATLAASVPSTT